MSQILEGTQFVQNNRMTEVNIRCCRVHAQFDTQWTTFF